MRPVTVFLGLLVLAAFLPRASAQTFLPVQDRDFSAVIPPPPADDSPSGLADLDTLLQLQKDRTAEQVARAQRVSKETPFTFAQPVLGNWFTARNLPRTAVILEEVHHEIDAVIDPLKHAAHRSRPYVRDPRVTPVVERPTNESYPSGHAANATVYAAVLTAAFPEQAAAFQDGVRETMWGRELGGVHYPTDTESGRLIGAAIARRMLANPAMNEALTEIRAEAANAKRMAGSSQDTPDNAGTHKP